MTRGFTHIWNRQANPIVLPWQKALDTYHKASAKEQSNWPEQDTLYPLTLDAYTRELTPEVRTEIKQNAIEALWKWHSPSTSLARIYPSERDWKEFPRWERRTTQYHTSLSPSFSTSSKESEKMEKPSANTLFNCKNWKIYTNS